MIKGKTLFAKIESILHTISYISVFFMMVLITFDTIGRYFFNSPIQGSFEITEMYLMVIVVFASLSYSYRTGEHIRIDILYRHFSGKTKRVIDSVGLVLSIMLFSIIAYQGFKLTYEAIIQNQYTFGVVSLPASFSYIWVPVGSGVLTARLVIDLFKQWKATEEVEERKEKDHDVLHSAEL